MAKGFTLLTHCANPFGHVMRPVFLPGPVRAVPAVLYQQVHLDSS